MGYRALVGRSPDRAGAHPRSSQVVAHPNPTERVGPERLAEEQAALRRVATLVARGASTAEVFEAVAAEAARLLGSDFSLVGRYEADATLTHVASHPLELLSRLGSRTVLDGEDLASVVQRSGRPTRIDYDDAPGPIAALARELGVQCAVGAPIVVDGRVWGVMAAGWALPGKASVEAAESDEFRHFLSGVDLIWKQLNGVLDALGIKPIAAVGEPFDPHIHEAVVTEATDEYEPDTVIQEILAGYRLGDKLIRPALVKVAKAK